MRNSEKTYLKENAKEKVCSERQKRHAKKKKGIPERASKGKSMFRAHRRSERNVKEVRKSKKKVK